MNSNFIPRRWAFGVLALALVSAGLVTVLATRAKEAEPASPAASAVIHDGTHITVPEASPLRKSLILEVVTEHSVAAPFVLPSSVEADSAKLVKVLPPMAGRIVSLNKRLGDTVKAGDVLFTIDAPDYVQALSDARKAEATLAVTRPNIERQRQLGAADIAAARDIEQAQNDFEQAASEQARTKARLEQLGAQGTAGTSAKGGNVLSVRSPISGRVVDLSAAAGAYWNDATAALMTVADLSTVFVTASAQEKDLGQLYVGQTAKVAFDAYPDALEGKVRYIGDLLDPDTRTVKARIAFDNRDGRLKPGMFARTTFYGKAHTGIVVPMNAVVQSGFASRAFVEISPGQFEARTLKLGQQVGDQIEVLAGLVKGDRVVVKNGVLLND